MAIRTSHDKPPIPTRQFDWSAINDATYDADYDYESGRYVSTSIVGRGPTELDAIFDLVEQVLAEAQR